MNRIKAKMVTKAYCKMCKKSDDARDAGLTFPENAESFCDLSYGPDLKNNILDLYKPKKAEGKLPVLVSAHGGGFAYGDKERYKYYTAQFTAYGFAVVNYNYSLTPKVHFPSPIKETNEVFRWIVENSEKYGLDTKKVVMIGDSAGAQITSQYAVCVTNPEYAKIMGLDIPDFQLKAVSLGCGLYDCNERMKELTDIEEIYLTKHPEQFGEQIKGLDYITKDFPPAYLMSAPGDFLLPKMEPMRKLLEDRGVVTKARVYGDEKTYHVFFCDLRNPYGIEANRDQAEFLKSYVND